MSLRVLAGGVALLAFASTSAPQRDPALARAFNDYWHAGKAEINRYRLSQSRYGELREGDAILVFVTEDFLRDEQVKLETGDREKKAAVPVLKCNFIKKFTTGIYDYSMMLSVFTPTRPAGDARSLKVSASIQEWCGQVYTQLNLRGGSYAVEGHSYFEKEADERYEIPAVWLEDELWTRIRLAPATLPTGKIRVAEGAFAARFAHRRVAVRQAEATLRPVERDEFEERELRRYELRIPASKRSLAIDFDASFPHEILAFEERVAASGGERVTTALRTHVRRSAYWNENAKRFRGLRAKLGLR